MIFLLIVLFLALLVAGGLVVLFAARRAPEGCEDGRGFHAITAPAAGEAGRGRTTVIAPGDAVLCRANAVAVEEPARTPDLELPFGAC